MEEHLSKERRKKALEQFRRTGRSISSWARENGFCPALVHEIIRGRRPCYRGKSHKIAVMLDIKDGVVEDV